MKAVPCAIVLLLMISFMSVQSCTLPSLSSFVPPDPRPTRPESIAQTPDLILLTHAPLFEAVARNMHPSWSPDSQELAFERVPHSDASTAGLYVIRADGSQPAMLWPGHTVGPAWSPDGEWIACLVIDKHGQQALMLLNRDGQRSRQVSDKGYNPSWSPDGQHLIYERYQPDGNRDLCLIDRHGAGFQTLLEGPADDGDPAWSPDGNLVAFSSNRDGAHNIYVMPAPGLQDQPNMGDPRIIQITHVVSGSQKAMRQPTWSPDSTRIAFVCASNPFLHYGELYVVDMAGNEPTLLLDAVLCHDPAWSPDGNWLAFSYGLPIPNGPLGSDIYLLRMKQ